MIVLVVGLVRFELETPKFGLRRRVFFSLDKHLDAAIEADDLFLGKFGV